MRALGEARLAGRAAALMGGAWTVGLVGLFLVNTAVLGRQSVMLLPVFALLALYLLVGGAVQWATGKGGMQRRTRYSLRATVAVQVGAFVALGLIQFFATGYWDSLR